MLKPEHIHISLSHRSDLLATEVRSSLPLHCSELIDYRDMYDAIGNHIDLYAHAIRNLVYAMYTELYQEVRDKLREIISQVADIPTLNYDDARRLLDSLQDAHSTTCPRDEDINNLVMSVLGSMGRGPIREGLDNIRGRSPGRVDNIRELTPGELGNANFVGCTSNEHFSTSEAQVPNHHVGDPGELEEAKKFVREFLSEVDSDDPGEIWRESR